MFDELREKVQRYEAALEEIRNGTQDPEVVAGRALDGQETFFTFVCAEHAMEDDSQIICKVCSSRAHYIHVEEVEE